MPGRGPEAGGGKEEMGLGVAAGQSHPVPEPPRPSQTGMLLLMRETHGVVPGTVLGTPGLLLPQFTSLSHIIILMVPTGRWSW